MQQARSSDYRHRSPTLGEVATASRTALAMFQTVAEVDLDQASTAAYTAFIMALNAGAPREISYLLEAAALEQWREDPEGPEVLLQLAIERAEMEVDHAS